MPPAMRVLVTRPREDAGPLAEALAERGFEPVIEPLLSIRFGREAPDLRGVAALAFTSANGVRALLHAAPDVKDAGLPVFAVGPASAAVAREAGFAPVESADGDVAALAGLIEARARGLEGVILHIAGTARAGDLVGMLKAAGIEARRTVLYEAQPARALSAAGREAIAGGDIGVVLIFSPRTAGLFVSLMTDAELAESARTMALVALSPAVAEAASALPWREVGIAQRPETGAVLDALQRLSEIREER